MPEAVSYTAAEVEPTAVGGRISGMQTMTVERRENNFLINDDYEGNRGANNRTVMNSEGHSHPQRQNVYRNDRNPYVGIQITETYGFLSLR